MLRIFLLWFFSDDGNIYFIFELKPFSVYEPLIYVIRNSQPYLPIVIYV